MSFWRYLFDNEFLQRADIETQREELGDLRAELLNMQTDRAKRRYKERGRETSLEKRLVQVEQELGEVALVCAALSRILVGKNLVSPQEIARMMRTVDLEDGVEDGRKGAPVPEPEPDDTCPDCHRPLGRNKTWCFYCGQAVSAS